MVISKFSIRKVLFLSFACFLVNSFTGCKQSSDSDELTSYNLSDVYGWTYRCVFTSSSGTTLKPQLTIFNDSRLDWNMSANGVGNMQYFYTVEKTGTSTWNSWWYKTQAEQTANDKTKAEMTVRIGIQSLSLLKVIAVTANTGAGNSMAGTVLSMERISEVKNTTPTTIESGSEIKDVTITVPADAVDADWPEAETTFKGTFNFLCAGTTGQGKAYKDTETPCDTTVVITKTGTNKVKVKTHNFYNTFVMELRLEAWEISDVKVKKSGDDYYLYLDTVSGSDTYTSTSHGYRYSTSTAEDFTIHGKALAGSWKSGTLTLRNEYAPGAMPLNIVDIFTGSKVTGE